MTLDVLMALDETSECAGVGDSARLASANTSTAEPTTPEVPLVTTPAADLEVEGLEHVQVLRITRDFGKEAEAC